MELVSAAPIVAVTEEPLDVAAHEAAVDRAASGARALFCGVVRDHDRDRPVVALEYQAHPSAGEVLAQVAAEIRADPRVLGLAVSHRVGSLAVGDIALVAVVSCAHRNAAFELCAELVDQVKARLPIWKRQVFADGSDEWVNCP